MPSVNFPPLAEKLAPTEVTSLSLTAVYVGQAAMFVGQEEVFSYTPLVRRPRLRLAWLDSLLSLTLYQRGLFFREKKDRSFGWT